MHIKWAKLSDRRLRRILRCFCQDLTATQTANIAGINRNTVNRYYQLLRERIASYQESTNLEFRGSVELDESYFGGKNKGRRGRGTAKIPVFGILKRDGRVYTQIIRNASPREIRPIVRRFVRRGSTIYTDGWTAYDGLVLNGYHHYRINHGEQCYSNRRGTHINGIESFWAFAKRRLLKFSGIQPQRFYLHLKECEFRYNNRDNLYRKMLKILTIS